MMESNLGFVTVGMTEEMLLWTREFMTKMKLTAVLQSEKYELILTEKGLIFCTKQKREQGKKPYGIPLNMISRCYVNQTSRSEPYLVLERKDSPNPYVIYPPRIYTGVDELLNSGNAHRKQMLYVQRWAQAVNMQIVKLSNSHKWTCSYCQMVNEGKFCSNCGSPRKES